MQPGCVVADKICSAAVWHATATVARLSQSVATSWFAGQHAGGTVKLDVVAPTCCAFPLYFAPVKLNRHFLHTTILHHRVQHYGQYRSACDVSNGLDGSLSV